MIRSAASSLEFTETALSGRVNVQWFLFKRILTRCYYRDVLVQAGVKDYPCCSQQPANGGMTHETSWSPPAQTLCLLCEAIGDLFLAVSDNTSARIRVNLNGLAVKIARAEYQATECRGPSVLMRQKLSGSSSTASFKFLFFQITAADLLPAPNHRLQTSGDVNFPCKSR